MGSGCGVVRFGPDRERRLHASVSQTVVCACEVPIDTGHIVTVRISRVPYEPNRSACPGEPARGDTAARRGDPHHDRSTVRFDHPGPAADGREAAPRQGWQMRTREIRLWSSVIWVDIRIARFAGVWLASADTWEGPSLGLGRLPEEALQRALEPFGDVVDELMASVPNEFVWARSLTVRSHRRRP